jgi:hypothetical protein
MTHNEATPDALPHDPSQHDVDPSRVAADQEWEVGIKKYIADAGLVEPLSTIALYALRSEKARMTQQFTNNRLAAERRRGNVSAIGQQ